MQTIKIHLCLFMILFLSNGCQRLESKNFHSMLESQPYLTDLSPNPEKTVIEFKKLELVFSTSINLKTMNEKSIFILNKKIDSVQYPDQESIEKDLNKGKLSLISGNFNADQESKKIIWTPSQTLTSGTLTVVITSHLEGINNAPFNQSPGEQAPPFMVYFHLPTTLDKSPTPPTTPNDSIPKIRPNILMINEALYDSTENETDGNEFIELYGTPNTDIDGYQLILVNGEDGKIIKIITLPENSKIRENGIFLIADAQTGKPSQSNIQDADFIDNFDPQNGPDAIQVLDDRGNLIDSLSYGEVKANQASNGLTIIEGTPAVDVSEGHSLSRINGKDTNNNRTDFIDLEKPTPGVL